VDISSPIRTRMLSRGTAPDPRQVESIRDAIVMVTSYRIHSSGPFARKRLFLEQQVVETAALLGAENGAGDLRQAHPETSRRGMGSPGW